MRTPNDMLDGLRTQSAAVLRKPCCRKTGFLRTSAAALADSLLPRGIRCTCST